MEYKKEFDEWNKKKKWLDKNNQVNVFYEKEIWWGSLGINIGSEQDGKGYLYKRQIYILKKINSHTFIGIPLSSVLKEDDRHLSFYFNHEIETALLSQVRTFDKKRLLKYVGTVSDYLHNKIKKTTEAFLFG